MAEGNYKEMDKEFSLDDFDPKPAEKTKPREETEPTENKKPEMQGTSNYLVKKIRTIKVTFKSGHRLMLMPTK